MGSSLSNQFEWLQELHLSPPRASYLGHIAGTKPLSPAVIRLIPVSSQ
jgi:hypothetical protein